MQIADLDALFSRGQAILVSTTSSVYATDELTNCLICFRSHRGNRVLLGIVAANIVLFFLAKAYYVLRNRHREGIWNGMTPAEKAEYMETTKDKGNKR